jgi:hypothetical protein
VSCIRRSRGTLTRALLQFLTDDEDSLKAILSHIAMKCKNLNHLEIRYAGSILGIIDTIPMAQNLNTLILHSAMRFEVSSILLKNCANLVHVEFHKLQYFSRHPDPWPNKLERIRKLDLRQCFLRSELTLHALILVRITLNKLFDFLVYNVEAQLRLTSQSNASLTGHRTYENLHLSAGGMSLPSFQTTIQNWTN